MCIARGPGAVPGTHRSPLHIKASSAADDVTSNEHALGFCRTAPNTDVVMIIVLYRKSHIIRCAPAAATAAAAAAAAAVGVLLLMV